MVVDLIVLTLQSRESEFRRDRNQWLGSGDSPLHTECELQHLDPTQEVKFYAFERPSLAFEQGYTCLWPWT